jgi:fimbrial isopeptide formation D2 family protein/uncharacterized repeat protein (TIGR01451 family)
MEIAMRRFSLPGRAVPSCCKPARALVAVAGFMLLGLVAVAPAQGAGTPNLQLSGGPAASVLYGRAIPIDLTAALPAGAPKGYNLAFRTVLPAGVSYKAGSAGSADGEPRILANAPTTGKTTLLWDNVDDLVANSSHTLSFAAVYNDTSSPGTPKYDVGDVLAIDTGAYISTDPRDETDWSADGHAANPGAGSYTGFAEQTTNTTLTAIEVEKSEPHPEGEIPRGVHDHQTVYTLTVTNNLVNPTNGVSLQDWVPAGLEFLGCAATPDHTTNAPTNAGSAEEYPGSGPIVVTHPTAAEDCVAPDLVETVSLDPDATGPLPAAVYTHLKWNDIGSFAAGEVQTYTYGAAIAIRDNTMTWSGATPNLTGAQAANLDNNSGAETFDEQPLLNGAIVAGTYQAPAKAGKAVSDEGTLLRTAEDIAIQKSNNNAGLEQGDLTKWTIDLQVSEYRSVDDVTIRDVVPNGLCPLGPANLEHTPPASQAECDHLAAKDPSDPYTTVVEQSDGTYVITWDKTTMASLAHIKPSNTRQLTFWTRTRDHYQSSFADAAPILSKDSVSNAIDTTGTDWVRCTGAVQDCVTTSGAKIAHDEIDGQPDLDVSGSGKAASGPTILKQVAASYPASGNCNDLAAAAYGKTVPVYGPGDQVCWKLRLDFPSKLNTTSQDVFDILPVGLTYVPGTSQTTSNNSLPVGAIDPSVAGRLRWPIGTANDVDHGGKVFEVTFKATVGSPLGHHSGDVDGNLMKFSFQNTPTTAFTLRDRTDFALKVPELALVKGVRQLNGAGTVFGPNSDHKQVLGADVVEYRVDVTNNGTAAASSSRIWDQLPTGIACADVQLGSISDGGTCNVVGNRIEWSSIPVGVAPATKMLTYKVTIPTAVSPDVSFVNTAGVVEFTYITNAGTSYQLIPANDVVKDPSLPAANAAKAQDVSDVFTPTTTILKDRTTSVTESGNSLASQATIGETVNYTVTTTIPHGTTMYGTPTVVDDLGARQTYVPGSLTATLNAVALPTLGVSAAVAANVITTTFPATWPNPAGDDTLVLTFKATVLDVNANIRSATLPNTATLTFKDELNRTVTHSSTVQTTIVEPKLALTKTHAPSGRVSPSQIVDFTVTASNPTATNVSTAHDVLVVDTLPIGTDPVDAGGTPIADGAAVPAEAGIWNATLRTITWDKTTTPALAALAPGAVKNLTYKVKLEATPIAGNTYTNVANQTTKSLDSSIPGIRTSTATSSTAPDYKATAQDVLSVILPSVTKDVTPDQVTIGNKVTWHVHTTLPRSVQYYDTTVVDTVPDGFEVDGYGAITCASGCLGGDPAVTSFAVTAAGSTKQAAWYVGDVAPSANDRVYDFVLNGHVLNTYRGSGAQVLDGQTLTNSVSVKTDRTNAVAGTPATVPGSFSDTVGPATAINHVVEPKLTLVKSADKGPFVEGADHVTYTIAVKNTGTSPAYDMIVDDQPDVELTNVVLGTGAAQNTDGWTAADPAMRWVVPGPVAVGATVTFTYTSDVKAATALHSGDQITNTAKVFEDYGVPKATRDLDAFTYRRYTGPQSTVTLTVALPDLSIVKTPKNGAATAGSPSSFTVKVTNGDPHATAHNVVVHDVLQAGLTYTAGTASASPAAGFSETAVSGQTIDWKITSLAPAATVTITVPVSVGGSVPNATTLLNTASTHADEVPVDKTDTGSLAVVAKADLQVTKVSDHDPVVPGTNIVYTMVVRNNGPSDALVSQLHDTLPSYLSFVSLDDPAHCVRAGQNIDCSYGTLTSGSTRTVHVTVRLDPSRTTPISNAADVTTTTTETNPANNHAEAPNTVNPTADVSIRKTADGAVYQGGDTVTYTLVAHNDGPSTATGVTVDDDVPSQLTFVSVTPGAPTCSQSAGHVHCSLGALAPGADGTVTITTTANGTAPSPDAGSTSHKITVDKAERAEALQAGDTRTWDVTCAANGIAADGSVEVMHVDQGTGSPADVQVIAARSIALGTYRFTVFNDTTGQAQVKLFVLCLPHDTDPDSNTHPIVVGALQTLTTGSLAPGRYSYTIATSGGHRAVSPGIEVTSGRARLVGGVASGNGWTFTVEVLTTANVRLSIRALDDYTGPGGDPVHVHGFVFQHVSRTATLPPGESVQRVECPVGYKGMVAEYDLPDGVVPLGNEPQPIIRDFRLLNTTDHNIDVTLGLVCIRIETRSPVMVASVVNTATVATVTFDPTAANNADSVTIGVERALEIIVVAPPPPPPAAAPAAPAPDAPAHAEAQSTPSEAAVPPDPASTLPGGETFSVKFGTVSVTSTGASATVAVTCSGDMACSGTVTIRAEVTSSLRSASGANVKRVVLGKATYKAKKHKKVMVDVKIAKRYRTLLRSGRVSRVWITSGKTTVTKKVVVRKRQPAKRG